MGNTIRVYRSEAAALCRMTRLQRQYPNKRFAVLKRDFGHAVYLVCHVLGTTRHVPCA